jgi:glutamate synthase domain-containing protein 2
MRTHFLRSLLPILLIVFALGKYVDEKFYGLYIVIVPIMLLGLRDIFQKKRTILRNYPVLGHFRYLLESIRPEIQQYFVERFDDGKPFSREQRSVVYQRAKGELDTIAFGTQHDVYSAGTEWLEHSLNVCDHAEVEDRVILGNKDCKQPYNSSRLNISAMSYGSLSKTAVESLNLGAKRGNFFHNTGEGAISPYHLKHGGDLCWQIGTGYFGCRNPDGSFCPEMFAEKAKLENVKLIEIKLSQGAKPGHGGMLPGSKVNAEVAEIRSVEIGKDVLSPPKHSTFSTPRGLVEFVKQLRDLSGGKPVGFKLCLGKKEEFYAICKAMIEADTYPDFITIDGSEGGTGAAPREFSNSLGTPLNDSLNFIHNALIATGIRKHMKLIVSGKVVDAFNMVCKFSLGADMCNSARGMMFAIGCIQALRCNSNNCPAGVATQDPALYNLLDIESKADRVANFHRKSIDELHHLIAASGVERISDLKKNHIKRRIGPGEIQHYGELYPKQELNSLVDGSYTGRWKEIWESSSAEKF